MSTRVVVVSGRRVQRQQQHLQGSLQGRSDGARDEMSTDERKMKEGRKMNEGSEWVCN